MSFAPCFSNSEMGAFIIAVVAIIFVVVLHRGVHLEYSGSWLKFVTQFMCSIREAKEVKSTVCVAEV